MARKSFSPELEKRLLKSALQNTPEGNRLLAKLSPDHFSTAVCSEAYGRVATLMKKRGVAITWNSLLEDPVLDSTHRAALREYKTKPARHKDEIAELLNTSRTYVDLRRINEFGKELAEKFADESVDIDDLKSFVVSGVDSLAAKNRGMRANHIGVGDNSRKLVRRLLKGDAVRYIPTGFKAFDNVNGGLTIGSLVIIAAPSGQGKSVMMQTLARNFALQGTRVCIAPLEMDATSMLQRELASHTQIALTKFIDPVKSMTHRERREVLSKYDALSKKLKRVDGRLTILGAEEDLSLESILSYARSRHYRVAMIDYVGLLSGTDGDDQAKALGRIGRAAKLWAEANRAIVVLAAQLSEDGLVRYSRALREHANTLWQWNYDLTARENRAIVVNQTKARMHSDAPFKLHFDPSTMTMRDLTEDELSKLGTKQGGKNGKSDKKNGRFSGSKKPARRKEEENFYDDL